MKRGCAIGELGVKVEQHLEEELKEDVEKVIRTCLLNSCVLDTTAVLAALIGML